MGRKICFLNRFYWPDMAATGQMLTDLAEDLASEGWDVTVVVSRKGYAAKGSELPSEDRRNGVRILRIATTGFGQARLTGRAGDYLTYLIGVSWRLMRLPKPDVVVAMSDPPFVLASALLVSRIRGFKTVYWLQDLYPHLAAKLGLLREEGILYRLLHRVARLLHAQADGVITLGPRMSQTMVASGASANRTIHIDNWVDADAVRPIPVAENEFLRDNGLDGKFVVLYSGNAGRAHTFESVLEAARRLQDRPEIVFLFIGGGKQFSVLESIVQDEELPNVRFRDYLPRERLSMSLSSANVSLVTENPDVVGLLVPSKTYGILASGRPLLFVGSEESDVAGVVREVGCGLIVPADDPDALVESILSLKQDTRRAEVMGARGRQAAVDRYDRRIATRRWAQAVESMLDGEKVS